MVTHPARNERIDTDLFREVGVSWSDIARANWGLALPFESDECVKNEVAVLRESRDPLSNSSSFELFSGISDEVFGDSIGISVASQIAGFH
jgi:hypothetical protein